MHNIEINPGEIKLTFTDPESGRISFESLGITKDGLELKAGLLRLVIDLEGIGEHHFYSMPTIEMAYNKNVAETHWQCDFNGVTILDKFDHHGSKTIILLDRSKLESLEQHHQNELVLHGEFPEPVRIIPEDSSMTLFK